MFCRKGYISIVFNDECRSEVRPSDLFLVIKLDIHAKIKEKLGDAYMVLNINGYTIDEETLRNWGKRLVPVVE
jgi:hypothetical protein